MNEQSADIKINEKKNELGIFIRARRQELRLSTEALAEKLGVSKQFVNQIELGKVRLVMNVESITKLESILELDEGVLKSLRPRRRLRNPEKNSDTLGGFIATKRSERNITQNDLGKSLGLKGTTICAFENGRRRVSSSLIKRIQELLNCEIPADLIPKQRQKRSSLKVSVGEQVSQSPIISFCLTKQDLEDIDLIKNQSSIRANMEVFRKALRILRILLEKEKDGYKVCLRNGNSITELMFLI